MGNLSITASEVLEVGSGNTKVEGVAFEAFEAGEVGYLDPASNKWKLEDADVDTSACQIGIFLNSGAANQPCTVLTSGVVDLGPAAGPSIATVYMVSSTAGKICPESDALLGTGTYQKFLCIGKGNDEVQVSPVNTDIQNP